MIWRNISGKNDHINTNGPEEEETWSFINRKALLPFQEHRFIRNEVSFLPTETFTFSRNVFYTFCTEISEKKHYFECGAAY